MTHNHDVYDDESRSDRYDDQYGEGRHLLDYVKVLYKRRWTVMSVALIVVIVGAARTFTETPRYRAYARILLDAGTPNIIAFQEVIDDTPPRYRFQAHETQVRLLASRALARRTLDTLGLWEHPVLSGDGTDRTSHTAAKTRDESRAIGAYLGSLSARTVPDSKLVDIVFTSVDPQLAADLANGHAHAFVEQNLEFKYLASQDASDWLGERLAEQRAAVEAAEAGLHRYRQEHGAVSFEDREDGTVQRLAALNAAVTRTKTELIAKEAEYRQLEEASSDPAALDALSVIASNTFIQQLKGEVAALEGRRAELNENLGARHPEMVKVETAIGVARARLTRETNQVVQSVRNEFLAAQEQEQSLTRELQLQKVQALGMNEIGIEYSVLLREAESTRQVYDSLLRRARETDVSTELRSSSIRIVDNAEVPAAPFSPNRFRAVLTALLFGAGLGVGLAFFFEYLDDRLATPADLKAYLGLTSLGLIPAVSSKLLRSLGAETPLMSEGSLPQFGEAFRKMRTGVIFSSASDKRLLVITSTGPSEGKSLVTTNLGIALAQAGQRVLLIDADMRRPALHTTFGRDQGPGLSDLLCKQARRTDVIRETSVAGLWLMPAGTLPPNPAELLGSNRFKKLLVSLAQLDAFDWVLIDSPPVLAVTDASLVANVTGGVIFVVGAEMSNRRDAQHAIEGLEAAGARFAGAVLNRVDLERNGYYYSEYYRSEYQQYYVQNQPPVESLARAGSTLQI